MSYVKNKSQVAHGVSEEPQHQHDSKCCTFLGRHEEIDIFICNAAYTGSSIMSILGRYGSEGPEYASSNLPQSFMGADQYLWQAEGWYHQALHRAIVAKMLTSDQIAGIQDRYAAAELRYSVRFDRWLQLGSSERMCDVYSRFA